MAGMVGQTTLHVRHAAEGDGALDPAVKMRMRARLHVGNPVVGVSAAIAGAGLQFRPSLQCKCRTFSLRVLQGCIWAMQQGGNAGGHAVHEVLQEIKGDMIKAGLRFNKRTHALFVEAHLLEGNAEVGGRPAPFLALAC